MMHDFGIPRSKFYSSNESLGVDWDLRHEISINIFAFGLHQIGFGNLDNQIGLTELPFTAPNGRRREIPGLSLDRATVGPESNQFDLLGVQPPLVGKFSITGFRQPWGHEPAGSNFSDLPGMFRHIAIGQE